MHRAPDVEAKAIDENELRIFEVAARDLIGLALQSLSAFGEAVSLPQFRLMLVLHERGRLRSTEVARALGLAGSSVTRLADRLVTTGYVMREKNPANRTWVTLTLSRAGRNLVAKVVAHRRAELTRVLRRLDPETRAACVRGLGALHDLMGTEFVVGSHNTMPL